MNRVSANGDASRSLFMPIRLKDFDVSWAGPNPFGPGFAFGSVDGRVLFTDEAGVPLQNQIRESVTSEAINGIAGTGTSMAVSTRSEVTLLTWTAAEPDKKAISGIPDGAHGITMTSDGNYVAPLGRRGVMILPPTSTGPNDPIRAINPNKEGLYIYRVVVGSDNAGNDLLACAARQGGMGITEVRSGQTKYNMRLATFSGLDLVDVCFVGGSADAPAVAGVGRDGALLLVRDALRDQNPKTMKFNSVQGTVYRLLCARGHLFALTNKGLYALMGLGDRLIRGLSSDKFDTRIFVVPMEAVDANLIGDRWLLITMPDEVLRLDLDLLERSNPENSRNGKFQEVPAETFTPDWQNTQHRSKQLAGAV